ncbi:MAG: hypothetical protein HZC51_06965 [Nitrospirae bacterium]|nr:hypothetical protein [Nitrospirota bacterium]
MTKTFLAVLAAIGLMVMLPLYACGATASTDTPYDTKALPPVEQTLVREGDFAFALAQALKLGEPRSEAEAEEMLALAGIAPESGWISDYPVTPAVIADIRAAVRKAASEGRIKLDMADADKAVIAVSDDFGLPAMADTTDKQQSETVAETSPATTYDETTLTEYYYDYGPPAITYYEPPYNYGYLYDYVYDPFWCSGHYFPGYYILQNFTIVIDGGRHGKKWRGKDWHKKDWAAVGGADTGRGGRRGGRDGAPVVSNQVVDPATGQPRVVDPATREVVAPDTERSRREARREEWRAGRIAAENPDRAGFRRARAEGRDVFGRGQSSERTTGAVAVSGDEAGARSLQRELSRGEGAGRGREGRSEARQADRAAESARTEEGGRERGRTTPLATGSEPGPQTGSRVGSDDRQRLSGRGSSSGRDGSGSDDRPMSVRGWTYGSTGGRQSDDGGSAATERPSINTGGGSSDRVRGGSRGREMNTDTGGSRSFEATPSTGDRDRGSRGRELNTNTGYAGRGRESAPSVGGGSSSGRSFDRPANIQQAPAMRAAPSYAPSRDFGVRSAPSTGGGSTGRSERAFSSPGQGGDRGGGREWSGGGRGGSERDGGHDRGGGRGGGSCRGRNC